MTADLSHDAAYLADVSLLVRARFVEAADTMAHLQVRGTRPSETSGTWPGVANIVDGEYLERYRPNAAAISRAEEVLHGWLLDFVKDPEHRVLVGRWSASLAVPKIVGSFRSWCKKTGRNRTTAERRLNVALQGVADGLLKTRKSLRYPHLSRVMPMLPDWGTDLDMVAERVAEQRETYWRADDAVPTNLPEERDTTWAEAQSERRRRRAFEAERENGRVARPRDVAA